MIRVCLPGPIDGETRNVDSEKKRAMCISYSVGKYRIVEMKCSFGARDPGLKTFSALCCGTLGKLFNLTRPLPSPQLENGV